MEDTEDLLDKLGAQSKIESDENHQEFLNNQMPSKVILEMMYNQGEDI
jgi:hypothetical protein